MVPSLKYYSETVHAAAFVLPKFAEDALGAARRVPAAATTADAHSGASGRPGTVGGEGGAGGCAHATPAVLVVGAIVVAAVAYLVGARR
jgi:hypothetical protein